MAIITDDNPRNEDPNQIVRQILDGFENFDDFEVIQDRAKAIEWAISNAEPGDCVLIAGKGHEQHQVVGNQRFHFDDRDIVRTLLKQATVPDFYPHVGRRAA